MMYIRVQVQRPKEQEHQRNDPTQKESKLALPLSFGSIQVLNRLDDAQPFDEDGSSLLSLLIQMPISSRTTLTDTPSNVSSGIWAPFSPGKLAHKINHHT